jgi:hypothetical protein
MKATTPKRLRRIAIWILLDLCFTAGVLAFSAWADETAAVAHPKMAGCYCGCAHGKTAAGCGKMCDLPKYTGKWWAVSCAKPRASAPTENPGAGPRMPHPAKAERASN